MFPVKKLSFTLNVGCAISSLELFCFGFRQITLASIVNCRRVSNFIDDGEKNMIEYVLYTRVPHVLVYNVLRGFIEKPFVCRNKDNRIRLQLLDPIKTDSLNINMD